MAPGDRGPDQPVRRSLRLSLLVGVGALGVASNALPQLAFGWPANPFRWGLLAVGALAEAVLVALSLDRLLVATHGGWAWLRRWRWPVRLRVLLAGAVALGLLVGLAFAVTNVWFRVDRLVNGCPEPTELRVLTTPEGLDPNQQLADAYERATAAGDDGCRTVNVYVYAAGADSARDALAGGWSTDALRDVGPRPDVWLPDSTLQVTELTALAQRNGLSVPIAENRTVAWSPIVVGVPGSVAETVQAPRSGTPWHELLARSARLPGGLVRPDPTSPLGKVATTALYADLADTGDSPRSVELRIEHALDRGGYPLGDASAALCRQRAADAPPAALVASEQALVRFNRGDPLGTGCPIPQDRAVSSAALLAFYPSGTPGLDHPFVRFGWDGGAGGQPPQVAAAIDLGKWLGTDDGKAALLLTGLRPPAGYPISDPLTNEFGALPGAVFDRRAPDPAVVATAMNRYDTARRTGQVLLALDTSGSMGLRTRTGATRLSAAAEGIRDSLDLMGTKDEFGLWIFPATADGHGVRQLVPVGSRETPVGGVARKQATVQALGGIQPTGDTPLYATIVDGVHAVSAAPNDRIRALVVLTDGEDTSSGLTAGQLVSAVQGQGVRVFVVAVGEASCAGAAVVGVASATGGGCYEASFDTVRTRLAQLFSVLWEGAGHAG
jgi:hypothetical protein